MSFCWQDELPPPPPPSGKESASERAERLRREDIRKERARERERERRLEAKDAHGFKKSKLTRDRDRDVSEKMALGQVCITDTVILMSFGSSLSIVDGNFQRKDRIVLPNGLTRSAGGKVIPTR